MSTLNAELSKVEPRSTAAAPRAEGQRKSNGDHELVFIIFRVLPDRRSRSGFPLLLEASLWWRNLLGDPAPPSICMPAARCVDANSDLNQANMWPCFALLSSKEGPVETHSRSRVRKEHYSDFEIIDPN